MRAQVGLNETHSNSPCAKAARITSIGFSSCRTVSYKRKQVRAESGSGGTGQQPHDPKVAAKANMLEKLLAQEGIELVTSTTNSLGFQNPHVDWGRYHIQASNLDDVVARQLKKLSARVPLWDSACACCCCILLACIGQPWLVYHDTGVS